MFLLTILFSIYTESPATQPRDIKASIKGNGYEFEFPNLPGGDRISHFEVEIRNTITDRLEVSSTQRHTILSGSVVRFQWDGAVKGNQYQIRFRGVNPSGEGPWSTPVTFGSSKSTLHYILDKVNTKSKVN